jgi:Domain of unknown function (DUF6362)
MQTQAELLMAVRELVRYAILTLATVRDPDARYQGLAKLPAWVVHDVRDAYGYSTPSVRRFVPTPRHITQMELLTPWLAWLRREHGDLELRRLMAWAMGVPYWKLCDRERCSDITIKRRIDRSIALMVEQFVGVTLPIEYGEEPIDKTPFAIIFERPDATSNGEVRLMKIYIGGRGFWRGGRYLDNRHRRYGELNI